MFRRLTTDAEELGVLLVDCPEPQGLIDVAENLYSENSRTLDNVDILVIRPPIDTPVEDEGAFVDQLDPFFERVPRASIHLLYSHAFTIRLSQNLNTAVPTTVPPEHLQQLLDWLREQELLSFVENSSALFPPQEHLAYRAPSQRTYNSFLRVGNIQTSAEVVDALFFWMIPHLNGVTGILTETWSISTTAFNAVYRLQRYHPSPAPYRVAMLSTYHDSSADLHADARRALQRVAGPEARTLVLLSAVATGNSLIRLRETLDERAPATASFSYLGLYGLVRNPPTRCLCNLAEAQMAEVTPIELSDASTADVVTIDPQTYSPTHISDRTRSISEEHISQGRDFFQIYQGKSVIAIHRNVTDKNGVTKRHHAVDLDIEAMLLSQTFRGRLSSCIRECGEPPAAIVVPRHCAGEALAAFAIEVIHAEETPRVIVHPDLHPRATDTPRQFLSGLTEDDSILVLDDVSVTGNRLCRYQKHLRDLGYSGRMNYVVGVARPPSDDAWNKRVSNLRYRRHPRDQHQVRFAEKVILPDWDEDSCPWCREQRALRLSLDGLSGDLYKLVATRINRLAQAAGSGGLVEDALWGTETAPPLGPGAAFFEASGASQADVIAAIASTLQRMRNAPEPLRWDPIMPRVLDHDEFMGPAPRYNELLIQLAILRMAQRSELVRLDDGHESDRRKKTRHRLLERDGLEQLANLELCVAILGGKLPLPLLDEADLERLRTCSGGVLLETLRCRTSKESSRVQERL